MHHLISRARKAPDHDRRRRRRQRPRTAAMVGLLSPRRVDSIEDMRQHKSSRVGGQKRRFGCAPRLCMASRAHAVESRREGLHDGSRCSRRRWRLRIRSPRLRLMVFECSFDKRWPQRRHLSWLFWPSDWQHRIRRRGPDPMRRWPFLRPWRTINAEATAFASAGDRGLSIKPSIMMAGPT